jgi:MerR family transcriptional regulator, light-induced transcriptional regulator
MDRLTRYASGLDESASETAAPRDAWESRQGSLLREPARQMARDDNSRWLARTIEAEIIPRLMLAHCSARQPLVHEKPAATPPGPPEVEEFARIAIDSNPSAPAAYVETLRSEGMPLDVIYMELLAPAARRLGALWDADLCDFTQVTLGLWRIQQVMYDLSPAFHRASAESPGGRRALLTPAPQSQHTFGLLMVSEFFRRAGWDVWARTSATAHDIVSAARGEWFDVCGLSIGSETHVDTTTSVILDVRKHSRNPAIVVMVGGPVVSAHPDLVSRVGADATAGDAESAVSRAEEILSVRSRLS